jgi:hypothetical protein
MARHARPTLLLLLLTALLCAATCAPPQMPLQMPQQRFAARTVEEKKSSNTSPNCLYPNQPCTATTQCCEYLSCLPKTPGTPAVCVGIPPPG